MRIRITYRRPERVGRASVIPNAGTAAQLALVTTLTLCVVCATIPGGTFRTDWCAVSRASLLLAAPVVGGFRQ